MCDFARCSMSGIEVDLKASRLMIHLMACASTGKSFARFLSLRRARLRGGFLTAIRDVSLPTVRLETDRNMGNRYSMDSGWIARSGVHVTRRQDEAVEAHSSDQRTTHGWPCGRGGTGADYRFSPTQQDEISRRWREGQSFSLMGRALGAPMHHVRRFLYQSCGVRQVPQQRSGRDLSGGECEEMSRGIAAAESARQMARRLGRSPSTVSREIARNGGRERYRAASADAAAHARGRRPKQAKLARRPALRALVEVKLALCWSPEQIAVGCDSSSPATSPCRSRTKRSMSLFSAESRG